MQRVRADRADPCDAAWREVDHRADSMSQEGSVVRALEAGANDYIVKPFRPGRTGRARAAVHVRGGGMKLSFTHVALAPGVARRSAALSAGGVVAQVLRPPARPRWCLQARRPRLRDRSADVRNRWRACRTIRTTGRTRHSRSPATRQGIGRWSRRSMMCGVFAAR